MIRRRLFFLTLATVWVAAAAPSPAGARDQGPVWATVNICSPTAVGVRANAPGRSRGARHVRFTLQWLSPTAGWVPVEGQPTSRWLPAGSRRRAGQAGWTFDLEAPPPGTRFILRAVAEVEGRGSLVTAAGLPQVREGQPPGTSLATCSVVG